MNAPTVFDRKLLRQRRTRALKKISDHDFLFTWASDQLRDRLSDINRSFETGVHIGVRGSAPLDHFFTMDIMGGDLIGDEEILPVKKESLDILTSLLTLHSVNDLPGTLIQIRQTLKPDGLFLAAMFGGETLYELRDCLGRAEMDLTGGLSPRIAPFADKQQMGGLMQRAGYALPVVDSDIIEVTYPSLTKLLRDIRGMGESNIIAARNKATPPKTLFKRAEELYFESYPAEENRIIASFEIIFLTGWAPHENQQKPLRPGSAENTLAEALDTQEMKTGEKAGS